MTIRQQKTQIVIDNRGRACSGLGLFGSNPQRKEDRNRVLKAPPHKELYNIPGGLLSKDWLGSFGQL